MTTHIPATVEMEKWLLNRVWFFTNLWLGVRIRVRKKHVESCWSQLRHSESGTTSAVLPVRDEWTVKFFSPSPVLIRWNWIRSSPDPQNFWKSSVRSSLDLPMQNHFVLFCLMRQNNYWSYFAFNQIQLTEGKIVQQCFSLMRQK